MLCMLMHTNDIFFGAQHTNFGNRLMHGVKYLQQQVVLRVVGAIVLIKYRIYLKTTYKVTYGK